MYIKMVGLYGIADETAWFRKVGNYCFDFVSDKKYASDLTKEDVKQVLDHGDWYCNQYNAEFIFSETCR